MYKFIIFLVPSLVLTVLFQNCSPLKTALMTSSSIYAQGRVNGFSVEAKDFEGEVTVGIGENLDIQESVSYVDIKDNRSQKVYSLSFKDGKLPKGLRTGKKVKMRGRKNLKNSENLLVEALEVLSDSSNMLDNVNSSNGPLEATEMRKVMVVSVNIRTVNSAISPASAIQNLYTNTTNANNNIQKMSYGHIGLEGDADGDGEYDVFGPITIDADPMICSRNTWSQLVDQKLIEQGVDLNLYRHKIYNLPNYTNLGCGNFSGWADIGCGTSCRIWMMYNHRFVFEHELGHNLGMDHSSTDPENDGIVNSEYGDNSDIMGSPYMDKFRIAFTSPKSG